MFLSTLTDVNKIIMIQDCNQDVGHADTLTDKIWWDAYLDSIFDAVGESVTNIHEIVFIWLTSHWRFV